MQMQSSPSTRPDTGSVLALVADHSLSCSDGVGFEPCGQTTASSILVNDELIIAANVDSRVANPKQLLTFQASL
jgi:hypothetical protein